MTRRRPSRRDVLEATLVGIVVIGVHVRARGNVWIWPLDGRAGDA